jgi:hypothetical protein
MGLLEGSVYASKNPKKEMESEKVVFEASAKGDEETSKEGISSAAFETF